MADQHSRSPEDRCVHELFEAQAERTPDAVAAVFEGAQLTYRELDRRANQLAHYLRQRGAGPEVLVALCLERSLDVPVALLGTLKAGAAYVPLDPSYPRERLAFMLQDTRAPILLTQERLASSLDGPGACTLRLDTQWQDVARRSTEKPASGVTPDNLAYVIYTSGSTGRPKGALLCHRGVCNHLLWRCSYFPLTAGDRVLQRASFGFDDSVWEFFEPLAVGARVVLAPLHRLQDPAALVRLIRELKITAISLVPSLLQLFVQEPGVEACTSLRRVTTGGEVLSPELQERFFARFGIDLHNGYGPTEATIAATFWTCQRGTAPRSVPIGRPIANTQVHVLDASMQPVPAGTPGELYIGGVGVGRGYLNRPELTAEKFFPDPFRAAPGARLYRTGDLGRYLPDGSLEFLGRVDHQVKIRGFRVELEEVEAALGRHPGVSRGAVLAREDDPGDKRLVAYWAADAGVAPPSADELRQFLQARLPEYMVPSQFVLLDALPLTASGKIDRQGLPAPGRDRPLLREGFAAARNPVEELVSGIWAEVLGLDRVGVHDNFFDLGGHSLRAAQVMSRVRAALEVELTLGELFEAPTVAGLAARVEEARRADRRSLPPPLVPVPRDRPLPVSFAQERLWLLDQWAPGTPAFNIPVAIRLQGRLDEQALERALREIVRRHEVLRTTFPAADGQPVQLVGPPPALALPRTDLAGLADAARLAEARRLAVAEASRPFDLATGPLLRARLLRLGAERHALLLAIHHIVADGGSMGVLLRELAALYQAFTAGKPSPLPELPVQYGDYAAWHRAWLRGEVLERLLTYWKGHVHWGPSRCELPADRPRPAVPTGRCARQSLLLPLPLADPLRALGRRERTTLFMTLLAGFQALLYRLTGQDRVMVGTPVSARSAVETEPLIGFFVHAVALETDLSGNPSFRELLARVRRVALGAFDHQELPFQKIVEELHPRREAARPNLIDVSFNMQPFQEDRVEVPGLVLAHDEDLEQPPPAQLFDLNLYLFERPDGILLKLDYGQDLFDRERIADMLEQFRHLLEQAAADPERRVDDFTLRTASARPRLPDPTLPLPAAPWDGPVHARFARQAPRCPERLAVVDDREALTYGQLDALSNRLANALRGSGIGGGDLVALYADRRAGLVWALLGILKAGAGFLILDPAYPGQRLADRLRLARPQGWLRTQAGGSLPPALEECLSRLGCRCRIRLADGDAAACSSALGGFSERPPEVGVGPEDLAYVAFTSGSTGVPKGILGTHRPVAHFIDWHVRSFNLRQSDRFSLLSGLAHDPLLREIFTPLCVGATLYIPGPAEASDPGRLTDWMRQREISVVHLSPALGRFLTEAPADGLPRSLRYFFFAGDVLRTADVARLRGMAPGASCVNFYGCTETPQAMGYHVVPPGAGAAGGGRVPIGKGIDGVQLLILNAAGRLAGVGEPGEVHVRTPYLSKGYVGDEAQTRARFLANPFTADAGDLVYRTGDVGRYLPDGEVEFVGRNDLQVKVRGFRVELEELEAALRRHPSIREAAVVARQEPGGETRLVAYLLRNDGPAPTAGELRRHLGQTLPENMLPGAFVFLDALPRTPNGKLDRKALEGVESGTPAAAASFEPAANPSHVLIREVWEDILAVRPIGIRDNFFDLGGHSLLAVRMLARLEQTFGRRLPLATLFAGATIADLALALLSPDGGMRDGPLVEIQKGDPGRVPFVYLHGDLKGGGFYCLNLARALGPGQPFHVLQPHGLFGHVLPTTLEGMAADHLQTLLAFQPEGPYLLGGYCNGGLIALEMARRLRARGRRVDLLVMVAPATPAPGKGSHYRLDVSIRQAFTPPAALNLQPLAGRERRDVIQGIYWWALENRRPQPYPGRVVLLQPEEEVGPAGYSMGWEQLAGEVQTHLIPGGHLTALTTHVHALGDRLRVLLGEASGQGLRAG